MQKKVSKSTGVDTTGGESVLRYMSFGRTMKMLRTLPGMRDILPQEIASWHVVEDRARRVFRQFGLKEIRTPVVETTDLFVRGIGGDTDIVSKEMYTFTDQGGTSMTLRPEATAAVVRAYIEQHMFRGGGLTKLYYIGPMFRHEKKQKGRWRQFYQIGAEVLGSDNPAVEAEVIEMLFFFLEPFKIDARLLVNSVGCAECRPPFIELLRSELRKVAGGLCGDCQRRTESNTLRVLDCKVDTCQSVIDLLPKITEHLCAECAQHFSQFKAYLYESGISFDVVPRLVRGLDYYVRTAFEIISGSLGAQNALVGGGRYDGLSEILGGPPAKGFGFAMGLDRLVMLLPKEVSEAWVKVPEVFVVHLSKPAMRKSLAIARQLRKNGLDCVLEFDSGSLRSQMRLANKLGARHVLIIGDEELSRDRYSIKRMEDSSQWDVSLPELTEYLQSRSGCRSFSHYRKRSDEQNTGPS